MYNSEHTSQCTSTTIYRLSSFMLSVVSVRMIKMKSSCSVVISNKGSQWGYYEG